MGYGQADRLKHRWRGGIVPYVIDGRAFPPGSRARADIDAAIQEWNTRTVIRLVPRASNERDFISFSLQAGRCTSGVGRQGGEQSLACSLEIDPYIRPGAPVALARQTSDLLTALAVDESGALIAAWVVGTGPWADPTRISSPNFAPPGAVVAMAHQTNDILAALLVENHGRLAVSWVAGTGDWQGPSAISPPNHAPPGAGIAMIRQTNDILAALTVDNAGALTVSWVVGTGRWAGPVRISPVNFAPPGARIAIARQARDLVAALVLDNSGALSVAWVIGSGNWQGPARITPSFAPPGAPIAMARQTDDVLAALVVDNAGALTVSWVAGTGRWQGPVRITPANHAPPRAGVAMAKQTNDILSALTVDTAGTLAVSWLDTRRSDGWQGPDRFGPAGVAPAGANVAMERQTANQLTALVAGNSRTLEAAWVVDTGRWQGPVPTRPGGFARGNLMHEIGHAVGLFHEHQRPDRGAMIQVNTANIRPGSEPNFALVPNQLILSGYDCGSIMHYSTTAFARRNAMGAALPTITVTNPAACANLGQRTALSRADIDSVAFLYGRHARPGGGVAMAKQTSEIFTALTVDNSGALAVSWVRGTGEWDGPARISPLNTAAPGGGVAMAKQTNDLLTALTVDNAGALAVSWVRGAEAWQGPARISGTNFAPPGARVAMAKQTNDILAALVVDNAGALTVSWVVGTGQWQGPTRISPTRFAPPGAAIAMAKQTNDVLTALTVDSSGALAVFWLVVTSNRGWQGPVRISAPNFAPPGARIAMAKQTNDVLAALTVDNAGALAVSWLVVTSNRGWQGPVRITPANHAPPGAGIAMAKQTESILSALLVDNSGAMALSWLDVTGSGPWQGPSRISAGNLAPPGANIAMEYQTATQLNALTVSNNRALAVAWVVGRGWQRPVEL